MVLPETRLRAHDKLLCNLRAEDEMEDASRLGFDFPAPQSHIMEEAISIFFQLLQSTEEEIEEEVEEEVDYTEYTNDAFNLW